MKNYGLIPKKTPRFHPTAHQIFGTPDISTLPIKFDINDLVGQVDQGDTNFCFGYCIRQLCSDIDQKVFDENYCISRVSKLMGASAVNGAPALTAMQSMIAFGPLPQSEAPVSFTWQEKGPEFIANPANWPTSLDAIAATFERIGVSNVNDPNSGLDAFDNVKAQMFQHNRSVTLATQWYPDFDTPGSSGMINATVNTSEFSWHMYEVMGFDTIDGNQYVKVKPHLGNKGLAGYEYFNRATVNMLAKNPLANVLIFTDTPQDLGTKIQLKKLAFLQIIVNLYQQVISLFIQKNG